GAETQQHVAGLYERESSVNALVITSRREPDMGQGRPVLCVRLYLVITQTPFMVQTAATSWRLSQNPCWMLSMPLVRPRLRAKLLRRAAMPGLIRILL